MIFVVLAAFAAGARENMLLILSSCVAYSPQLGQRLKISHTQLNIVALAGNGGEFIPLEHSSNLPDKSKVGISSSGPIWGRIVDSRGPRILLACSFVFLLGGFSGIRYLYNSGLAPDVLSAPVISFCALLLCSFLTGAGNGGGVASSVNSTAKTFPDRAVCILCWRLAKVIFLIISCQRASTTGLVISGYGLSAFLFSAISHIFLADDPSQLLLLLSLGSSFPMILGFFFVRPIPLPEKNLNREVEGYLETSSSTYEQRNNSHTPLLNHDNVENISGQDDDDAQIGADLELSPSPNVYGKTLWCSSDFWLLCSILSISVFVSLSTIFTYLCL